MTLKEIGLWLRNLFGLLGLQLLLDHVLGHSIPALEAELIFGISGAVLISNFSTHALNDNLRASAKQHEGGHKFNIKKIVDNWILIFAVEVAMVRFLSVTEPWPKIPCALGLTMPMLIASVALRISHPVTHEWGVCHFSAWFLRSVARKFGDLVNSILAAGWSVFRVCFWLIIVLPFGLILSFLNTRPDPKKEYSSLLRNGFIPHLG